MPARHLPLRVVILDCDGVILESVAAKTQAFAGLFSGYGPDAVDMIVQYHLSHGGLSRYEKFRHFFRERFGREITDDEMVALDEEFSAACVDGVLRSPFVPGALEFITQTVYPLYVCSGAPEYELERIFAELGVTRYFRGIHGSPRSKPEIIGQILAKEAVDPLQAVMVGDSLLDLRSALTCGTRFLGRGTFPRPWPWLPDLRDIEAYFEANPGPEDNLLSAKP